MAQGQETAAERGEKALTSRAYTPAPWTATAFDRLWRLWEQPGDIMPKDYDEKIRERYGLHPAPFKNGKYPMGLRETTGILAKGVTSDCMLCHGGSIFGKSYIGLGNASLDIQGLFEDLNRATGISSKLPFTFSNVRGTSEAGAMAVFLLSYREPDLAVRLQPHQFELNQDLCEDVPAWWLLQKKKTMYFTGSNDTRSVRSIMQFMLSPTNSRKTFEREEATFVDIREFLLSLTPPAWPKDVDAKLARQGHGLFREHCANCHGSYAPDAPSYPNKIVPLEVVGTDPKRYHGIPRPVGEFYNQSWFAEDGYKVQESEGYQAPPLDGVWATAPYFHNGSAPTLEDVLNSKVRPKIFTRSYRTDETQYDVQKVGWKVKVVDRLPSPLSARERRQYYDTTQPGRSNTGHTFGDGLTADERRAVIEYLKTL